jgi:hypothetical protein
MGHALRKTPVEFDQMVARLRGIQSFRAELPAMLRDHRGQWVAFRGEQCLGFAATKSELRQRHAASPAASEILIKCVEPESADSSIGPRLREDHAAKTGD